MSVGKVLIGVLAGFTAGAMVGVLFAPDKGAKTRKKISEKGQDYVDDLKEKFDEVVNNISERFENLAEKEKDYAEQAKSKVDKISKTIKSHLS